MRYTYKLLLLIVLTVTASSGVYAQELMPQRQTADQQRYENSDLYSGTFEKNEIVDVSCSSYRECSEKFNSLSRAAKEDVRLVYYNSTRKDIRYKLFDNIFMRIGSDSCPPVIDVYQEVNNINFMLDVYKKSESNGCVKYYSNLGGPGSDRNSVIGQLELVFCEESPDSLCEHSLFLINRNLFE